MAGVRDPQHDVAPAVGHRAAEEFCTIRGAHLGKRRVDRGSPLIHAFRIGVVNDQATRRRRYAVYVRLVDGVERGHALSCSSNVGTRYFLSAAAYSPGLSAFAKEQITRAYPGVPLPTWYIVDCIR